MTTWKRPYIDDCTDQAGQIWRVNDLVRHMIPGVRSDEGRIAEIFPGGVAVRIVLSGCTESQCYQQYVCRLAELELVRRRTADEIPCCAKEKEIPCS